jgi:XRE family aerobic/anaerobic benzoate catabolism transcriptional regulator
MPHAKGTAESPRTTHILHGLGRRVRALRRRRAWTRDQLAQRSGLSSRFLARVEAGDGNISVVRLDQLARALETTAESLLRPEPGHDGIVALVGMRGAGKSSVGPLLGLELGAPFVEMDRLIVEAAGLPIDQIFELHGERHYRRLERETLARALAAGGPIVLAAGGGIVNEPSTWEMLCDRATVVWLRAAAEDHWNRVVAQGDRRPMADNPAAMQELRELLRAREPLYAEAHVTIDTARLAPKDVAAEIARRLGSPRD